MFGRHESLRDLIRNQHEEVMRYLDESREFNREILLRNEKVYTAVIAEMEKQGERIERGSAQLEANTKAVLSVLDRLA